MREVMRIQKARVAMGELDTVGSEIWDQMSAGAGAGARPRAGRVVSESVVNKCTLPTVR